MKKINQSKFNYAQIPSHSPDKRRLTFVKVIAHRRRDHEVDDGDDGEARVYEGLNKPFIVSRPFLSGFVNHASRSIHAYQGNFFPCTL